jgi:hypothetical protein
MVAGIGPSGWQDANTEVSVFVPNRPPYDFHAPGTTPVGTFSLGWKASHTPNVDGYEVHQWDSTNGWVNLGTTATTTFPVSGLLSDTYKFRIRTLKTGYDPSAWVLSQDSVVTLQCLIPRGIGGVNPNNGLIYWQKSLTAGTNYELHADSGGGWVSVYTGPALSWDTSALAPGTYMFRVRAVQAGYVPSAWRTGQYPSIVE